MTANAMDDGQIAATSDQTNAARKVVRHRPPMNRRAIVGALLITVAAGGVLHITTANDAEPHTRFLVSTQEISAGTVLATSAHVAAAFEAVPLALPAAVAGHAINAERVDDLIGYVVTTAVPSGQLVRAADVARPDAFEGAHIVDLPLAPRDALGGNIRQDTRIDVLATYRDSGSSFTDYLARDVHVVAVEQTTDGGLGASELLVRLALDSAEDVQAVGHAVRTAEVFVARTIGDGERDLPPRYRTPLDSEDLPDLTEPSDVVAQTPESMQ